MNNVEKGRDPQTGQFVPGGGIRPRNPGRPRRGPEAQQMLEAITAEFSLDEIRSMLRYCWETAVKMEDWKGQLSVLQYISNYAIGKPVQRSISAKIDVDEFRRMFEPKEEIDVTPAQAGGLLDAPAQPSDLEELSGAHPAARRAYSDAGSDADYAGF